MSETPFKARSKLGNTGDPTAFQRDLYILDTTSYPTDLFDNAPQYGGNFVVFYINVNEQSKLIKKGMPTVESARLNTNPSMRGNLAGLNVGEGAMRTAAGGAGALAGSAVGDKLGLAGAAANVAGAPLAKAASKVIDQGAGALVGIGAAQVVVSSVGEKSAQYKRIKNAIALYMPADLQTRYSMNWSTDDSMAGTNMILGALNTLSNTVDDAKGGGTAGLVGAAGDRAGEAAGDVKSYLVGAALNSPGVGQGISKVSGVTSNPKQEQLFKNVNFREFQLTFDFMPRSQKEAAACRQIIKEFKLHMHPEYKDGAGFLYTYPSEFDIYFYNNGYENMNLHRHTSCVLTDMVVQYTTQGQFNTFADGMPVHTRITLQFKELALLSKEAIEDGY